MHVSSHASPLSTEAGAISLQNLGFVVLSALLMVALAACGASLPSANEATVDELRIELVQIARTATTSPQSLDGAVVGGTITVDVRGNPRIDGVAFWLDAIERRRPADFVSRAAPHRMTIDTTALAEGAHTLTVETLVRVGQPQVRSAHFQVVNGDPSGPAAPGDDAPAPTEPEPGDDPGPEPHPPSPPSSDHLPPATLYVATDGDDANDGRSPERPLRTLQRAANLVGPGDTVYLRGGVYPIQVGFRTSGTASQPITWTSHPGEWAILDGSDQTPVSSQHRVWITDVRYNHFLNFEVRYGPQAGIFLRDSHDNLFRNLVTHGNHYSGILAIASDRNRFEQVVTYDNYDRFNPSGRIGDDADGISISSGDRNVLYRVIAFRNSDDGIDTWRATNTVVDACISFDNGRGSHGNGNGIKAGGNSEVVNTIVRNSIAFHNRSHGFDSNSGREVTFVNNTSFGNGGNSFVAGSTTRVHNNISVGDSIGLFDAISSHNSWDLGIDDPGFVSTHPYEEGFLALRSDSPAIGAGSVSLGTHADLGAIAFELTYGDAIGTSLLHHLDLFAGR